VNNALESLNRLREGNARFVNNECTADAHDYQARRNDLVEGQQPFAIILGCSDSRVPAEIVFDQGLGDLFVIRVAGNVVAPSQVASVEFAAEAFGVQLVVVMGHTHCGAISATLDQLRLPLKERSENLHAIVDRIRPSVETLLETDLVNKPEELKTAATRSNVRACVAHLQHGSKLLEQRILQEGLVIVGAQYDIETGEVEFFDNSLEDSAGV
jgi:carbonic anhydrase